MSHPATSLFKPPSKKYAMLPLVQRLGAMVHLPAVVGKVVRCGRSTGCQTDGGCRKTMTKRHRRSHGGRDITPRTVGPIAARRRGATTPRGTAGAVPRFTGRKHKSCPTAWEARGPRVNRGGREWTVDGGGSYAADQNIKYHLALLCRVKKKPAWLFQKVYSTCVRGNGWSHFLLWNSTPTFHKCLNSQHTAATAYSIRSILDFVPYGGSKHTEPIEPSRANSSVKFRSAKPTVCSHSVQSTAGTRGVKVRLTTNQFALQTGMGIQKAIYARLHWKIHTHLHTHTPSNDS